MPDNPTTALVKTSQPPALARVSSQLALTDKLLICKPLKKAAPEGTERQTRPRTFTREEWNMLSETERIRASEEIKMYNVQMENYNDQKDVEIYFKGQNLLTALLERQLRMDQQSTDESVIRLNEQARRLQKNLSRMKNQLESDPITNRLMNEFYIKFQVRIHGLL